VTAAYAQSLVAASAPPHGPEPTRVSH
jgi:hypothetical protein